MKRMTESAVLLFAVVMAGSAAIAQSRGPAQPPAERHKSGASQDDRKPGDPLVHCLSTLDLDEGQKTQIASILDTARPVSEALHEQIKTDRKAFNDLLEAEVPDACATGSAALKLESDCKAGKAQRQAVLTSVEAVLTPEQKTKLAGCLEGAKGHGHGPGGGGH